MSGWVIGGGGMGGSGVGAWQASSTTNSGNIRGDPFSDIKKRIILIDLLCYSKSQ